MKRQLDQNDLDLEEILELALEYYLKAIGAESEIAFKTRTTIPPYRQDYLRDQAEHHAITDLCDRYNSEEPEGLDGDDDPDEAA